MSKNQYLELLKLEYSKTYDKRTEKSKLAFSYVTIIISVLAACIILLTSLSEGKDYSLLYGIGLSGVCVFTDFLIVLALENTVRTYQIAGYLQYLEEEINRLSEKPVLLWESILVSESPIKRVSNAFIVILSGLIYLFIGGLPIYLFIKDFYLLTIESMIPYFIFFVFEFLTIPTGFYLVYDLTQAQSKFYKAAILTKKRKINNGSVSKASIIIEEGISNDS